MAISVEQLLSFVPLNKPVQVVLGDLPDVLPPEFFTLKEDVIADKGRHVRYNGTRKMARVQAYGSPPRQVAKLGLGVVDFKLLHSIEDMPFSQEIFTVLMQWDDYKPQQQFALDQIVYQGEEFKRRQVNLRRAAVQQSLATGVMYFDADGNMLPTAAGADLVLDQGVPAGNRNDCSGVFNSSWANPACDIVVQMQNIQTLSRQRTGRTLEYAFYGRNVASYISRNTAGQQYLARNPVFRDRLLDTNLLPDNFMGIRKWVPVQDAFFEDDNGVVREQFPADQITFTPAITKDWYTLYEGSYPAPTSFSMFADAASAFRSMRLVQGMGRFAYFMKPTVIAETQFDTFLPRFKVAEAVFIADTTL